MDNITLLNEFRNLIKEVKQLESIYEVEINEMDKAFGDIRHFCELDYPVERKGKTNFNGEEYIALLRTESNEPETFDFRCERI